MNDSAIIMLAVLIGGSIGQCLHLPSGALIGGMFTGLIAKGLTSGNTASPVVLSVSSQLLVAYIIVAKSDVASILQHPEALPAAFAYVVVLSFVSLILAYWVAHSFGLELRTAIYATAPGALSGIALSATETGADAPVTLVFHITRIAVILIITPLTALWLTR